MAQAIGHSCEKNPTLFCRELNGSSPFYIFRVFPTFVMKATCRLICSQYTTMAPSLFLSICLRVTQKGFCQEIEGWLTSARLTRMLQSRDPQVDLAAQLIMICLVLVNQQSLTQSLDIKTYTRWNLEIQCLAHFIFLTSL